MRSTTQDNQFGKIYASKPIFFNALGASKSITGWNGQFAPEADL
jgi:hypothetical protein